MQPEINEVQRIIDMALAEDVGQGDITSELTIDTDQQTSFTIGTRQPMIVCGVDVAKRVFHTVNDILKIDLIMQDGTFSNAGNTLLTGHGNALSILKAERVALNVLRQMCGVATHTKAFVDAIEGTKARILDTRKTTPGLRALQKYAVKVGGGYNHRFGLSDGILIKDNHIAVCGGVKKAIQHAKDNAPSLLKIEVECDTLKQVKEAVAANPDVIMLDNMDNDTMRQAVEYVGGRITLEASGNVNLKRVKSIAETGVDYISVGAITNATYPVDIGLDMELS